MEASEVILQILSTQWLPPPLCLYSILAPEDVKGEPRNGHKKNPFPRPAWAVRGGTEWKKAATYSPALRAVPSARAGLTSLFGMGRGGTPPL